MGRHVRCTRAGIAVLFPAWNDSPVGGTVRSRRTSPIVGLFPICREHPASSVASITERRLHFPYAEPSSFTCRISSKIANVGGSLLRDRTGRSQQQAETIRNDLIDLRAFAEIRIEAAKVQNCTKTIHERSRCRRRRQAPECDQGPF